MTVIKKGNLKTLTTRFVATCAVVVLLPFAMTAAPLQFVGVITSNRGALFALADAEAGVPFCWLGVG